MQTIDRRLESYQLELSQVRNRQRDLQNRASEQGQIAAIIEAKIQGIQEAKELFEAESAEVSKPKPRERQRHRPLSAAWKAIMRMADDKGEFDYDDLGKFATAITHPIGRDTLRSQMSGYKSLGLVEALGGGRFRVTEDGRKAAGIKESGAEAPQQNGPPEGGPDVDPRSVASTAWDSGYQPSRPQGARESE